MEILRGAKSDKGYSMLYQDFLALPQLVIDHIMSGKQHGKPLINSEEMEFISRWRI